LFCHRKQEILPDWAAEAAIKVSAAVKVSAVWEDLAAVIVVWVLWVR
jgi:hypothetical protein